ncbi:MAG: N-acetylmuramoyl-L-alanine amidase [Spirochaetales bacterium]|nr:N-acetylmuramoyl-L-alanine amidase [Spirochaetales bacterium]
MKKAVFFLLLIFIAVSAFADYIELTKLLHDFQYTLEWDELRYSGVLHVSNRIVVFKIGVPWVLIDYKEKVAIDPILMKKGAILLSDSAVAVLKNFIKEKTNKENYPRISVIMLDPGHGGKDPGTIGYVTIGGKKHELKEKDIVLKIGLKVEKLLSEKYPDKKIIMTRTKDVYPTLEDRVKMANNINLAENEAMIFVSIHVNASFNKKAKGFEIWYLPPEYRRNVIKESEVTDDKKEIMPILNSMLEEEYTIESVTLARDITNALKKEIGRTTLNRGLKAMEWYVVRKAKMPSVLIEVGFVTNPAEGRLLSSEWYLIKISKAIYNGICSFIDKFENTRGFTE